MNSQEFYLWLNGYLDALESAGIDVCKIKKQVIKHYKKQLN